MKKNELFEIFDRYDTYEFIKEGESIHGIKWNDLNGLADELVNYLILATEGNFYLISLNTQKMTKQVRQ